MLIVLVDFSTAKEEDLKDIQPHAAVSKPFRMSDLKEVVDRLLADD